MNLSAKSVQLLGEWTCLYCQSSELYFLTFWDIGLFYAHVDNPIINYAGFITYALSMHDLSVIH